MAPPLRFASPVVPALWEAAHQRIPEGGMTDQLLIERPTQADGEWGAATAWTAVYGPARGRVEPDWNKAGLVVVGGEPYRPTGYIGAIPIDAPAIEPGDRVTITDSRDPQLVGRRFLVVEVGRSVHAVQRRFLAQPDPGKEG